MLVAGFRVVAVTSAGELTYHTDSHGNAVSCSARTRERAGQDPSALHTLPPSRPQADR